MKNSCGTRACGEPVLREQAGLRFSALLVLTRTKLDSLLQLVKALRKVENLMECHTTLERVVARRAKEKCTKDSDFNPSVVNRKFGGYCNWCWRIGHKEAQCWFKQEYMKSNPSQDPLQRDVNGQIRQRKGKVTASPRAKAKARARENIQEKGTTTRTRLDLRMKMDSARWVIFVKNVRELNMSKRMMILRLPDWIEQLMCFAFKKCKSVVMGHS